jgi:hypothetical protein
MSSLKSCSDTDYTFPLDTTISDVKSFYKEVDQGEPKISAKFKASVKPTFLYDTRENGEIRQSGSAIKVTYNNETYNLLSIQICLATHKKWIINNSTSPVKNNIDMVI